MKRNLESRVDDLLKQFPAVVITGVRQCGKTTLSKQVRPDWAYKDLEKSSDRRLMLDDPTLFFKEFPGQVILDEVQLYPDILRELRSVIDENREQRNRFILTGSSSPELIKGVSDSLAGRVAIIELGTAKMNELYNEELSPIYELLQSPLTDNFWVELKAIKTRITYEKVMNAFYNGGYPEPSLRENESFSKEWMEAYIDTYVQRDIRSLFPKLNLEKYQRLIHMLSHLSGSIVNRAEISKSLEVSESAVADYIDIANGSYLWRTLPSFASHVSKSVQKSPKGALRDSGLCLYFQNIHSRGDLINHPRVGNIFESFVVEELIKGLQACGTKRLEYYHYRTKNGSEVDLVLKGPFGILPIEIKMGSSISSSELRHLKKFLKMEQCSYGLVVSHGEEVYRLAENIIHVPVNLI